MGFHPCMRACWQRWKRHGNALTLISSSQCTRWCIDCRADQLETFCLPLFGGAERQRTEFYHAKPPSQRPYSFHCSTVLFFFQENISLWLFSTVKCCQSQFRKEVITYCSSYDDNQCDYAEGRLSANSKACSFLLHLLSFPCSQLLMFKMSIEE